jgi:trans-AT polyketide synthase/acyltransferase/oxidoreductase domain-containing protein
MLDGGLRGGRLGSREFRQAYGVRLSYYSGSMYRGISSKELVVCMGRAGLLGFLGSGGLDLDRIGSDIRWIRAALSEGEAFGVNIIANMMDPENEIETARLLLQEGVSIVEASAFTQVTPALVLFRLGGGIDRDGQLRNRIIAKVSHPDVARQFMSPPPKQVIDKLLAANQLTPAQAALAGTEPVATDICVEADSGGHTDQGVALVLLPTMQRLRQEMGLSPMSMRVGLGGGIGTPEAAAAAFALGADFIVTGSINQCTAEAGMSAAVKELLQTINVQDTAYAPAGDMFELGAKVQVLKRGVFFPSRANRLFMLYSQYDSLDDLPEKIRIQLEEKYFRKPLAQVWEETCGSLSRRGRADVIEKASVNPKLKMAMVFRRYFGASMAFAFAGTRSDQSDFQVHTGPAMGAFNQWVKGGAWEHWSNRHVDEIAIRLMGEAEGLLIERLSHLTERR